jgi:hypothetical protein
VLRPGSNNPGARFLCLRSQNLKAVAMGIVAAIALFLTNKPNPAIGRDLALYIKTCVPLSSFFLWCVVCWEEVPKLGTKYKGTINY